MIDGLDEENYDAMVKFVLFLSESQKAKKKSNDNAFFDAVGKIDLDADDVTSFREKSLI